MKILVKRNTDEVLVKICRNRTDGTYSFVNLTKGNICECRFKTVDDAIDDMKKYQNILSWEVVE